MTMRTGTAAALAVAALAALPAGAGAKGFSYGVTSSEVTSSSALVWTRADKAGKVKLVVSADKKFGNKGDKKKTLSAKAAADNVVQVTVRGLKPGKRYAYRFTSGKKTSAVGHFKTAPKASQAKTLRFAYSGDTDAQRAAGASKPFYNNFEIYKQMAKEGNDFNVNFGDTIYSDTEVGATLQDGSFMPAQATALTVPAKWAKYKQNLKLKNLQAVRAATGMYNHWDDHEFINDFTPPEAGTQIYNAGVTAFRSYMPVTYSSQSGIYRSFKWGKNAEVFFLDERSFRSPKASANGVCNNPDTNAPDLAPTAPKRERDKFAIVTPSLAQPVSQACLDAINNPASTMLGSDQYARFTAAIKASTAKFKIVMNEVPIQQFYALPYDRWEGYSVERAKLLTFLQANVKNVVFLTTDTHANLYNDVRFSTFPEENNGGGPVDSGIDEMVTGPVATMTFTHEINSAAGRDNAGDLVTSAFFKPPPPEGVGMACAATDVFSYSEVKVTSSALTITPKDINGKLVHEKGSGAPPCGPFTIAAK
jgi:phosphodiesterase/alkaline phosphatase D-like protein